MCRVDGLGLQEFVGLVFRGNACRAAQEDWWSIHGVSLLRC